MSRAGRASLAVASALAVAGASMAWAQAGTTEPATVAAAPKLSPRLLAGLRVIAGFEGRRIPKGIRSAISAGDISG